jgi:tetratricopeptide (TPR) repeat protein
MQLSNTTSLGNLIVTTVAVIVQLFILTGCVVVTDQMVNKRTTKSQEAAFLARQGLSSLSKTRIEEATIQFLKASQRNSNAESILSSLISAHIELGDIDAAKRYITKIKYQTGIPARSQLAYANTKSSSTTRIASAQALFSMGEEILLHRQDLTKIQDYDPFKNAAALFSQSYGAFYDAGQYNDAVCALRLAYELAPTPTKASFLLAHLVALGRNAEALALLDQPYFKSNREVVGARDLYSAITSLMNTGYLAEVSEKQSSVDAKAIFSDVESDAIGKLRNVVDGSSTADEVDSAELFVTPPALLVAK